MVTHNLVEAARLGDWIVLLNEGQNRSARSFRRIFFVPSRTFCDRILSRSDWRRCCRENSLIALLVGTLLADRVVILASAAIVLGSKKFTESFVLAELAKRNLEEAGFNVEHRQGMGGTIILWEALRQGSIAAYPDYTGTIQEEILKRPTAASIGELREQLAKYGVGITEELGFNNTYALVMTRARAEQLGIQKISDLSKHPELRLGLTHEFLGRHDGWGPLEKRYGLIMSDVRGIDHTLGYLALLNGEIDVKDAYTTDAKIDENDLVVLADDLNFFPQYRAVFLYRLDTPPRAIQALRHLEGTLDEAKMVHLNEIAEQTKDYSSAADWYFKQLGQVGNFGRPESLEHRLVRWTVRHLILVGCVTRCGNRRRYSAGHLRKQGRLHRRDHPGADGLDSDGPRARFAGAAGPNSISWDRPSHRGRRSFPVWIVADSKEYRHRLA